MSTKLPACIWREPELDGFLCNSPRLYFSNGRIVQADFCASCSYAEQPEKEASKSKLMTCIHRGDPTGEFTDCPSCSGTVRLKIFACKVKGSTDSQKCQGCDAYEPKP